MTDTRTVAEATVIAAETTANLAKIIPLKDFDRAQKPIVIRIAEVLKDKQNATIEIRPEHNPQNIIYSGRTPQMHESLSRTFDELIGRVKKGEDLRASEVLKTFKRFQNTVSREWDPKVIQRRQRAARAETAKTINIEKKNTPTHHYPNFFTATEITGLENLVEVLKRNKKNLTPFNSLVSLGIKNVSIHENSLCIDMPYYEDDALNVEITRRAHKIVSYLVASIDPLRIRTAAITPHLIKRAIESSEQVAVKTKSAQESSIKEASTFPIKFTSLLGASLSSWANEIDTSGRSAVLRAFGESTDFGFSVSLSRANGEANGFDVKLNTSPSTQDIELVSYVLEQFKIRWQKNSTPKKADVAAWLKDIRKQYDSDVAVNNLSMVFQKTAKPIQRPAAGNSENNETLTQTFGRLADYTKPGRQFRSLVHVPFLSEVTGIKIGSKDAKIPTENQLAFINAMRTFDIVITHGPAGSGKTMWAAYEALKGLADGRYARICLTAPAHEAGEQLGFRKGDTDQKMNGFVNQILEHMEDIFGNGNLGDGKEKLKELMSLGLVEIAPHADNRGRNYENTFYLLDENQNALWKQLITAVTRISTGSTFVFMGDTKGQNDRTFGKSAYSYFVERFDQEKYAGHVKIIEFGPQDIKRHPLIKMLIEDGDDAAPVELDEREAPRYGNRNNGPSARDVALSGSASLPAPGVS